MADWSYHGLPFPGVEFPCREAGAQSHGSLLTLSLQLAVLQAWP